MAILIITLLILPVIAGTVWASQVRIVSVASDGTQANDESREGDISLDGNLVVYQSLATNLVENDATGGWDVFLYDRRARTTKLISVDENGNQLPGLGTNSGSMGPRISGDGRTVAFIHKPISGGANAYVYNTVDCTSMKISYDLEIGRRLYTKFDKITAISDDGRYVSVQTTDGYVPLSVIHDLVDGTRKPIRSGPAAMSGDGMYVISPEGSSIVPYNIYFYDIAEGTKKQINYDEAGNVVKPVHGRESISNDGRYMGYQAREYVHNGVRLENVFIIYDRDTDSSSTVFARGHGILYGNGMHMRDISPDGQYLSFITSQHLVPGLPAAQYQLFEVNLTTGELALVSKNSDGEAANFLSWGNNWPRNSYDGRYIVFKAEATNLVPGDVNGEEDVFLADRADLPDDIPGLIEFLEDLYTQRKIKNTGILTSLTSKLRHAQQSAEWGNVWAANNTMLALIKELEAQAGTGIDAESALTVIDIARTLMDRPYR